MPLTSPPAEIASQNSSLEKAISDWLVELIDKDELYSTIQSRDHIAEIVGTTNQTYFIPNFTIDYVSRYTCAKASAYVLSQLSGLEIVAIDKSISLKSGEILRPDIIAYNPETRVVVVFEVKRETATERQAITELMGYEHELQNHFPFLANLDLCFVIVARDWSTLLDHAVGSMVTWSGKQCLALKLDFDAMPRQLSCHLPSAWHLLGSFGVPSTAIQAVDLVLYEATVDPDSTYPPSVIETAIQVIARNGDRANSHGFLMLCEDRATLRAARWIITICALDPVVFFFNSKLSMLPYRNSELTNFYETRAPELASGNMPSSALRIVDDAIRLLSKDFSPQLENFTTWHEKLEQHKTRAIPWLFEFWGKPGEYVRGFVSHPGVRDQLMPYVASAGLDWRDPDVAVPVIEYLSGRRPFPDGVVRCSDAFYTGVTLGVLAFAYQKARDQKEGAENWAPLVKWAELQALSAAIEMAQIYYSSETLNQAPPALSNHADRRERAAQDFVAWTRDHFIGNANPIHLLCFQVGYCGAVLFDTTLSRSAREHLPHDLRLETAKDIKCVLSAILHCYTKVYADGGITPEHSAHLIKINDALMNSMSPENLHNDAIIEHYLGAVGEERLIDSMQEIIVPAADGLFPSIFHNAIDAAPLSIDWQWLRDGVKAIFAAGDTRPAVLRKMNGEIGTGQIVGPMGKFLAPLTDPDVEVYFLDERTGFAMATKTTWDELINGGVIFRKV